MIVPGKPYGQITVSVPSGQHVVNVYYRESALRLIFDFVSLVSLGVCLFLVAKKK